MSMFYALTILSLFFIYDYLTGISSTQHPNKQQHIPHSFSIKNKSLINSVSYQLFSPR